MSGRGKCTKTGVDRAGVARALVGQRSDDVDALEVRAQDAFAHCRCANARAERRIQGRGQEGRAPEKPAPVGNDRAMHDGDVLEMCGKRSNG